MRPLILIAGLLALTAVKPIQNVRKKEEVDELMGLAQKAGAKITKPAQKAFWGGYHGYFQDPDGHLWEIVYNPNWNPDAP